MFCYIRLRDKGVQLLALRLRKAKGLRQQQRGAQRCQRMKEREAKQVGKAEDRMKTDLWLGDVWRFGRKRHAVEQQHELHSTDRQPSGVRTR